MELKPDEIGILAYPNFPPAIFNDATRLDGGHRERLSLQSCAANLNNCSFKHVLFLQFDDRTVRLYRARGNVLNFDLTPVQFPERNVDFALGFSAPIREYFNADVVGKD